MGIKAKVSKGLNLEDGKHTGVISKFESVERGEQKYEYIDVYVTTSDDDGNEVELRTGFPTSIGKKTKLGKFLNSLGVDLETVTESANDEGEVDLEATLQPFVNRKVTFLTNHEESDRGNFVRIVDGSMRLA